MSIPKPIVDELVSLEAQLKRIQDRIDIYHFVISAFESESSPTPRPERNKVASYWAPPVLGEFDYTPLIETLRSAPPEGLPHSSLQYDHSVRLTVLKRRKIATKLPSGNWVLLKNAGART